MLQQKYLKNLYAVNLKTYPEVIQKNHYTRHQNNVKMIPKMIIKNNFFNQSRFSFMSFWHHCDLSFNLDVVYDNSNKLMQLYICFI